VRNVTFNPPSLILIRCLASLLVVLSVVVPLAPATGHTQSDEVAELGLTISASAELWSPDGGDAVNSLVVRAQLANQTERDLRGLSLRFNAPALTRVAEWWSDDPSEIVAFNGPAVTWAVDDLPSGTESGSIALRLVPSAGANGAVIFRKVSLQPTIVGLPSGVATSLPELRLNGLWGETGLRRTVVPSGLTIFTRERPDTTTVAIRVGVRAGSRDEDEITRGGSHWLEHAHFLGTVQRASGVVDDDITNVGGDSNASTGWEATDYWDLVPAEHFDVSLDWLADILQNSTFPRDRFDRERRVVFEELKMRDDTPSTRAFDEFIRTAFLHSPLRQHPAGTIESVQNIPIETILAYRAQRYVTGNMAVAASGNLHHDEAVSAIAAAFSALPRGPWAERTVVHEPIQTEPRLIEVGDGTGSAQIRLGWPVPGDDSDDSPAFSILDDTLSTTGRRLVEEIRERRGLVTAVDSAYYSFSDAGLMMLSATTRVENVDEVVELLLDEINRIRDGDIDESDVQASLRAMRGRKALDDETNRDQTYRATIEVSTTLDSYDEYLARLESVTPADVQRVTRQYLDPDNYTLVIVRP